MGRYNYRNRWKNPHKAGEQMYAEKKKGKHLEGDKAGQDLTEYEKGVRAGYLEANHDHVGMYHFFQWLKQKREQEAAEAGSRAEAARQAAEAEAAKKAAGRSEPAKGA